MFDDIERRSYLGAVAGGLSALAGCSGTDDDSTATTTGDRTATEETSRPTDEPAETTDEPPTEERDLSVHDHSGPDAGGADLSPASVTTERLLNDVDDAAIQASFDGLVVPVAEGLGMDAAVDPSETDTPIQDAIDAIDREYPAPGGAVLLPAGQVEEAGPLLRTKYKRFLGWGTLATEVKFTDLDEPGIAQDPDVQGDAAQTYWDGIRFLGGDPDIGPGDRTAPWLHLEDHGDSPNTIGGFNVGRLRLDYWGDPVIHFDGNFLFESHWEWFETKNSIYGRSILSEEASLGGSGWSCGKLNLRRSDAGRIVDGRTNRGGILTVQSLHLMHTEQSAGQDVPAVDVQTIAANSDIHVNKLHYESSFRDDYYRLPSAVRAEGGTGRVRIDDLTTLRGSFDHLVELTGSLQQARIGRLDWSGSELTETPLLLTGYEPTGWTQRGNVLYEGPSEHVTDETGSRLGHVYALGDQRVVDPLFGDTVVHEAGGETRVVLTTPGEHGGRELQQLTPAVQTLEPTTMPDARFGVDHWFEWHPNRGDGGAWALVLEWRRDPGTDVEFDVEVTARSADGPGIDFGGQS